MQALFLLCLACAGLPPVLVPPPESWASPWPCEGECSDVMLILDVSRSMGERWREAGGGSSEPPTRLEAGARAARQFTDAVDRNRVAVGIVAFSGCVADCTFWWNRAGKREAAWTEVPLTSNLPGLSAHVEEIARLRADLGSHIASGIDQATIELMMFSDSRSDPRPEARKLTIVLTDGAPTLPYPEGYENENMRAIQRALDRARRASIAVVLIAIGPESEELLELALGEAAHETGGVLITVSSEAELADEIEALVQRASGSERAR
jgi:Mg-chelatase subunit ChlD